MDQPTCADQEYQGKKRKTRRELFLERMDGLIPWQLLEDRLRDREVVHVDIHPDGTQPVVGNHRHRLVL